VLRLLHPSLHLLRELFPTDRSKLTLDNLAEHLLKFEDQVELDTVVQVVDESVCEDAPVRVQ